MVKKKNYFKTKVVASWGFRFKRHIYQDGDKLGNVEHRGRGSIEEGEIDSMEGGSGRRENLAPQKMEEIKVNL